MEVEAATLHTQAEETISRDLGQRAGANEALNFVALAIWINLFPVFD